MKASIKTKLENLSERFEEIAALLSQPEVQSDQNKFRSLSQEYAQIDPIVACYTKYQENEDNLEAAAEMAKDSDPELREMAKEEQQETEQIKQDIEHQLQVLLLPKVTVPEEPLFLLLLLILDKTDLFWLSYL